MVRTSATAALWASWPSVASSVAAAVCWAVSGPSSWAMSELYIGGHGCVLSLSGHELAGVELHAPSERRGERGAVGHDDQNRVRLGLHFEQAAR